jgi:tripartite-type tricarboxylate transporter receptor subunit TctC
MTGTDALHRRSLLALAAAPLAAPALAQPAWPSNAIRFIGLFPPGGGTDIGDVPADVED